MNSSTDFPVISKYFKGVIGDLVKLKWLDDSDSSHPYWYFGSTGPQDTTVASEGLGGDETIALLRVSSHWYSKHPAKA